MITPFLQDDAFLASLAEPPPHPDALRLWWLGQSGFLVRWREQTLLFDPYLSDSLTAKYAATDKPHVRMTARVLAPERLTGIDVVTSTHNHTDHLDAETLRPLRQANPQMRFVVPEANRAFVAERLGIDPAEPEGLDDGTSAAAHNTIDRDSAGHCHYLGYVVRCGPWTLYHSGDTLLHPELARAVRAFAPIDLALLPINGNRPERRVAGNLDGREAAQLAAEIGARRVIPCHYGLFEFNTADPAELFLPECRRLGQPYSVLRAGEPLILS
jgi:L-ascorbate metabolism protein UlaG (beta-lactamase superfamily)